MCVKCDESLPVWRNNICNHCNYFPSTSAMYVHEWHAKKEQLKQQKNSPGLIIATNRLGEPINIF